MLSLLIATRLLSDVLTSSCQPTAVKWAREVVRPKLIVASPDRIFLCSSPEGKELFQVDVLRWDGSTVNTFTEPSIQRIVGVRDSFILLESGAQHSFSTMLANRGGDVPALEHVTIGLSSVLYLAHPFIAVSHNGMSRLIESNARYFDRIALHEESSALFRMSHNGAVWQLSRYQLGSSNEINEEVSMIIGPQPVLETNYADCVAVSRNEIVTVLAFESSVPGSRSDDYWLCSVEWRPSGSIVSKMWDLSGPGFAIDISMPHRRMIAFNGLDRLLVLWGSSLICLDLPVL